MEPRPKKLLDQLREAIRLKHYAYRTEETYVQWARQYILFHDKRHPNEMGRLEIEAFLTHLAVQEQVAASTQNQALNAILFLYREVLNLDVSDVSAIRAKRTHYLPTVLTKVEVQEIIQHIYGVQQLMVKLLYGGGLRLCEGLRQSQGYRFCSTSDSRSRWSTYGHSRDCIAWRSTCMSRRLAIILISGQIAINLAFVFYIWTIHVWQSKVTEIMQDLVSSGGVG